MTTHYVTTLGVAKCREILKGAPEWATKFNDETKTYTKTVNVVFLGSSYASMVVTNQHGYLGGLIDLNSLHHELSLHDTDSCTDIRNHLSPNTVVVG